MSLSRTRTVAVAFAALIALMLGMAGTPTGAHAQPNTGGGPDAATLKKQACDAVGTLKSYWANETNRRNAAGDKAGAQQAWASYVAARTAYEDLGCAAARANTFTPQSCASLQRAMSATGAPAAATAAAHQAFRDAGCRYRAATAATASQSAQMAHA